MFHNVAKLSDILASLREGSTWNAIGIGITAAAVLPEPFNYIVGLSAVMGAVLKDRGATAADSPPVITPGDVK